MSKSSWATTALPPSIRALGDCLCSFIFHGGADASLKPCVRRTVPPAHRVVELALNTRDGGRDGAERAAAVRPLSLRFRGIVSAGDDPPLWNQET